MKRDSSLLRFWKIKDDEITDEITDRVNDVRLGILRFVKTHFGARIDEIVLGTQDEFDPQNGIHL